MVWFSQSGSGGAGDEQAALDRVRAAAEEAEQAAKAVEVPEADQ